MPKTDRGVAQRYAAKKRKKRVLTARGSAAVAVPPAARQERELSESDAALSTLRRSEPRPATRPTAPVVRTGPVVRARPAVSRRPFAAYADEYRYVGGDLRRVALVSGGLLAVLLVLSLFIH